MSDIPGYPLAAFLHPLASDDAVEPSPATVNTLHDADVIVGRDRASRQEFIIFGRETLQRVAQGIDDAGGYNLLCIEIDAAEESDDLMTLLDLVELVKGRHDYLDFTE